MTYQVERGAAQMKTGLRKAASLLNVVSIDEVTSDVLDEDRSLSPFRGGEECRIRRNWFFISCCIQCGFSFS